MAATFPFSLIAPVLEGLAFGEDQMGLLTKCQNQVDLPDQRRQRRLQAASYGPEKQRALTQGGGAEPGQEGRFTPPKPASHVYYPPLPGQVRGVPGGRAFSRRSQERG